MRRVRSGIVVLGAMLSSGCSAGSQDALSTPLATPAVTAVPTGSPAASASQAQDAAPAPSGSSAARADAGQPSAGAPAQGMPQASLDPAKPAPDPPPEPDPEPIAPPACPATSALMAGDSNRSLQHEGRARSYLLHVPRSYTGSTRVPLVLDFHGRGGSGAQEAGSSGWREKADAAGFIAVFPDGIDSSWNVGNCCGQPFDQNIDDVGFAKAIVAEVSAQACVDARRVYATGLSNGAGLTHRLACEAADVFAAIAAASADLVTDPCTPARPISELSVRGTGDTLVGYDGGNVGSTGWYSPGALGTFELWKGIDQCTGEAQTNHEYCQTYAACLNDVEVTLCTLPGVGHILYSNSLGFSVTDVAWEMFERQPMR